MCYCNTWINNEIEDRIGNEIEWRKGYMWLSNGIMDGISCKDRQQEPV